MEKSLLKNRESRIRVVKQYRLYPTRARQGKDPFGSPPFLLGGSLRVTRMEFSIEIPRQARDDGGGVRDDRAVRCGAPLSS